MMLEPKGRGLVSLGMLEPDRMTRGLWAVLLWFRWDPRLERRYEHHSLFPGDWGGQSIYCAVDCRRSEKSLKDRLVESSPVTTRVQ